MINRLANSWLMHKDLDYHILRASMVFIFLFFGYQKWFEYEAKVLIPYISNGPLIFWLYPVFGIRGASWFLGAAEWLFAALLFLGFWNTRIGVLGALGSIATFLGTVTVIPFMPDGWAASAGGFPAMTGSIPSITKRRSPRGVNRWLTTKFKMRWEQRRAQPGGVLVMKLEPCLLSAALLGNEALPPAQALQTTTRGSGNVCGNVC
jgi:uncharacterized membrane protein YkgB